MSSDEFVPLTTELLHELINSSSAEVINEFTYDEKIAECCEEFPLTDMEIIDDNFPLKIRAHVSKYTNENPKQKFIYWYVECLTPVTNENEDIHPFRKLEESVPLWNIVALNEISIGLLMMLVNSNQELETILSDRKMGNGMEFEDIIKRHIDMKDDEITHISGNTPGNSYKEILINIHKKLIKHHITPLQYRRALIKSLIELWD